MIGILPNIEDAPFQNGILVHCKLMREAKRSNAEYQDYRFLQPKTHLAIGVEVLDLSRGGKYSVGIAVEHRKAAQPYPYQSI